MTTLQERRDALLAEVERMAAFSADASARRCRQAQIALLDELIEQEARDFPAVEPEPELLEALITLRVGGREVAERSGFPRRLGLHLAPVGRGPGGRGAMAA